MLWERTWSVNSDTTVEIVHVNRNLGKHHMSITNNEDTNLDILLIHSVHLFCCCFCKQQNHTKFNFYEVILQNLSAVKMLVLVVSFLNYVNIIIALQYIIKPYQITIKTLILILLYQLHKNSCLYFCPTVNVLSCCCTSLVGTKEEYQ